MGKEKVIKYQEKQMEMEKQAAPQGLAPDSPRK
jgi:hypothetical protein